MHPMKRQYFLCFAVLGSLMPVLSVYLEKQVHLTRPQIGQVYALAAAAIIFTPALLTLLADLRLDSRKIIAGIYVLAGLCLGALLGVEGFLPVLIIYALYSLSFIPMLPLQDGLNRGVDSVPYHIIRAWGTIGFIVPSLALYVLIDQGFSTASAVATAIVCCALGLINIITLPKARSDDQAKQPPVDSVTDQSRSKKSKGVPTIEALKVMAKPPLLILCIGMALVYMANSAYYTFYPLYLTEHAGFEAKWLGLISSLGVLIEVPLVLGYGRLVDWMGVRRLILLGVGCVVLRLVVLTASSHPAVAVGTQLVHGITVLALHVSPAVLLNRMAEDRFRSSIQGLWLMMVVGPSKIVGLILGGLVAAEGISILFGCGAVSASIALCLFAVGLRVKPVQPKVQDQDKGEQGPAPLDEKAEAGGLDMEPV